MPLLLPYDAENENGGKTNWEKRNITKGCSYMTEKNYWNMFTCHRFGSIVILFELFIIFCYFPICWMYKSMCGFYAQFMYRFFLLFFIRKMKMVKMVNILNWNWVLPVVVFVQQRSARHSVNPICNVSIYSKWSFRVSHFLASLRPSKLH